jgi:hypothetical protein
MRKGYNGSSLFVLLRIAIPLITHKAFLNFVHRAVLLVFTKKEFAILYNTCIGLLYDFLMQSYSTENYISHCIHPTLYVNQC